MVTSGNSKLSIPTFIPVTEAARIYNLTEDVLTRLIQDGRIEAAQLPSGELLVSDDGLNEKTKEQIIEEKYGKLIGQRVTVTDAAEKYDLPKRNILEWAKKQYIAVLKPGYRMELDEAEVAYCALVYHRRKKKQGAVFGSRIFDEDGNPYHLKHPELAKIRRKGN